jgi:hypothetical protein
LVAEVPKAVGVAELDAPKANGDGTPDVVPAGLAVKAEDPNDPKVVVVVDEDVPACPNEKPVAAGGLLVPTLVPAG